MERVVQLTILVPSVTVWNVWDLPLWAWRAYSAYVDDYRAQRAKEARDGG